jgi:Fic family protein
MTSNNRAGRYVRQLEGYSAFIPAPLPPDPAVRLDGRLQALLSRADVALGRLDGSIQTLPDPNLFVFMYVRKEAVLSSQIEGTQSSLDDLLAAEEQILDPDRPRDVDEVLNHVGAMNYGLVRLAELPLSVRLIREIHERLMQGVRGQERQPGELRTSQNWIGPAGCTLREATFVPPPPTEVPRVMGGLETFLHQDEPAGLVQIGLAHAQFETIHPFLDGNGRIGRLLIGFYLCERRILQQPVLYISHYFRRHRQRYYELLQAIRETGDWESWLEFFLEAVGEVAEEATETARGIVGLRERHRQLIIDSFGRVAGNGLRVLEALYRRPILTVNVVMELTGVTFPAASQLVHRFVESGILTEMTGKTRNRRFRYGEYVSLFSA